jgi:rod shape-determining protein MreC
MFRKPQYVALGLVLVLALIVLNLPDPAAARLKLALGSLFLPLFGLASSAQHLAGNAADAVTPKSTLLKEIGSLRQENERLRLEAAQAREFAHENARLRQQLGWQQQKPWKLKPARVLLRDPANWWRTIQIDAGTRDGLRTNLPVLTPDGLVGRIASVSVDRAQVVLLGDPNCKVAALVENDNRDQGVLGQAGPLDSSLLEMNYLNRNALLKPGQNVVTSGEGGIFQKEIPIGTIVDSRPVEYGLYLQARVKLAANPGALEEVWVLLP